MRGNEIERHENSLRLFSSLVEVFEFDYAALKNTIKKAGINPAFLKI
jgi:hypothetical protein